MGFPIHSGRRLEAIPYGSHIVLTIRTFDNNVERNLPQRRREYREKSIKNEKIIIEQKDGEIKD